MKLNNLLRFFLIALVGGGGYFFLYKKSYEKKTVIAITQICTHESLSLIRKGIEDVLHKTHKNVKITFQDAQGQMPTALQIAQKFLAEKPKIVVAITTPSAQACHNVFVGKKEAPLLFFCAVSDPASAGFLPKGKLESNVIGLSDALEPIMKKQLDYIHKKFGSKKVRIAFLRSAQESNAHAGLLYFKRLAEPFEYIIDDVCVTAPQDIAVMMGRLIHDIDVIVVPNDNVIASNIESVLRFKKFTIVSDPASFKKGGDAFIGYDQYKMGIQAGNIVTKILEGTKPEKIGLKFTKNIVVSEKK